MKKDERPMVFFVFLLFLGVLSGCAAMTPTPDKSFRPTNELSLVFGRLDATFDNGSTRIPYTIIGPGVFEQRFIVSIDPFTSPESLPKSMFFDRGKYNATVGHPDGYFSVALPAGRYAIVFITYIGPKGQLVISPHLNVPGGSFYAKTRNPKILTFDVLPQQSNYIGTIKLTVSDNFIIHQWKETSRSAPDSLGQVRVTQTQIPVKSFGLEEIAVVREFDNAKQVFASNYPSCSGLSESLCRLEPSPGSRN